MQRKTASNQSQGSFSIRLLLSLPLQRGPVNL